MEAAIDGANVRFPPPLFYAAGLLLGIVGGRFAGLPGLPLQSAFRSITGGILDLLGIAVMVAGAGLFLRRRTAIVPFKPASSLVTNGVFRWTRNPMYLGMALFYAGLSLNFDSLAALILLPFVLAIIQTKIIAREEAYLERAFGSDYLSYKKRVGRWITFVLPWALTYRG